MHTTAPAPDAPAGAEVKPRTYAAATVPEPYQILGLKLLPFSIGHYLLLQRFDCAFVREQAGFATHADLILGVMICSMRPAEFLEFMESPTFAEEVALWGKQVGGEMIAQHGQPRPRMRSARGGKGVYPFDFKPKAELFMRYLKDGWQEPPHINKGGGKAGGDWAQNVKITLMARLSYTDAEVMEMPMSKALADYYKLAESEGVIQLLTEADMEAMAANEKAMRELSTML